MKYSTKLPVFALPLSIFAFVSCQKDIATNNEAEQVTTAKTADLVYKADYDCYQVPVDKAKAKINQVAEALRANNLQLRSETTLPIAEAIWDIEALSNATQARANFSYKQLSQFKSSIPLVTTTENGQKRVSMQEISAKFASAVAAIQQAETNTGFPAANRETIYADAVPFEDGGGNVVLELNIGVGLDPEGCPNCPLGGGGGFFDCAPTDCWKAGFKNGTCNTPASGPGQGTLDASDIIESYVGLYISNIEQIKAPDINVAGGYYINFGTSLPLKPDQYLNPNWQQGQPQIRRKLLYKSNQFAPGGFVDCLTPSDITFFRYGVESIIFTHKSANPTLWAGGKYLLDWNVFYTLLVDGTQNLEHHLTYTVANYVP
jgi:hypothetical protein